MSIFISIASYCDPVLPFTVHRAVATASQPKRLHFGIVDQSPEVVPRMAGAVPARLSLTRIAPVDARGPCWARSLAMSLYDGEDWFLQLDSHMDFDPGWDELLVQQARALGAPQAGLVISSYPNAFVFQAGQVVRKPTTNGVLAHVVKPGTTFAAEHRILGFEAHPVETRQPLPGFHLGAGCLFAPGRFVNEFPYDPWFYFHGEEHALALRLFTHGWDIFHMPGLPVHHLYNTGESGAPARPLHWDSEHDQHRATRWHDLEGRSRRRFDALVAGQPLGVFGLGSVRPLAQYTEFCGIDFAGRTVGPRAFQPLTAVGAAPAAEEAPPPRLKAA